MRVILLGGYNLAISSAADLLETKYKPEPIDLSKYQPKYQRVGSCYKLTPKAARSDTRGKWG